MSDSEYNFEDGDLLKMKAHYDKLSEEKWKVIRSSIDKWNNDINQIIKDSFK